MTSEVLCHPKALSLFFVLEHWLVRTVSMGETEVKVKPKAYGLLKLRYHIGGGEGIIYLAGI